MIAYFILLVVIIGVQFLLQLFLGSLGLPLITIELLVNLVIAFIFSFVNYRGDKKEAIKDLSFHRSVFGYFIVFSIISFVIYGINYLL